MHAFHAVEDNYEQGISRTLRLYEHNEDHDRWAVAVLTNDVQASTERASTRCETSIRFDTGTVRHLYKWAANHCGIDTGNHTDTGTERPVPGVNDEPWAGAAQYLEEHVHTIIAALEMYASNMADNRDQALTADLRQELIAEAEGDTEPPETSNTSEAPSGLVDITPNFGNVAKHLDAQVELARTAANQLWALYNQTSDHGLTTLR